MNFIHWLMDLFHIKPKTDLQKTLEKVAEAEQKLVALCLEQELAHAERAYWTRISNYLKFHIRDEPAKKEPYATAPHCGYPK